MTQVSTWFRDHLPILEERVQPILDEANTNLNAKVCMYVYVCTVVADGIHTHSFLATLVHGRG